MKLLAIIAITAVLAGGCGARVRPRRSHHPRSHKLAGKRGYPLPIPGCAGAFAFVPDGCFASEFADRVEVNCPDSTAKFNGCPR